MERIRKFAQTKFRAISKDLDMNTVPVDEPAKLAKFYSDYASKIDNNEEYGGWAW
jgi:hypothetical protein